MSLRSAFVPRTKRSAFSLSPKLTLPYLSKLLAAPVAAPLAPAAAATPAAIGLLLLPAPPTTFPMASAAARPWPATLPAKSRASCAAPAIIRKAPAASLIGSRPVVLVMRNPAFASISSSFCAILRYAYVTRPHFTTLSTDAPTNPMSNAVRAIPTTQMFRISKTHCDQNICIQLTAVSFVLSLVAVANARGESKIVKTQMMYRSAHSSTNLIRFHQIKNRNTTLTTREAPSTIEKPPIHATIVPAASPDSVWPIIVMPESSNENAPNPPPVTPSLNAVVRGEMISSNIN